MTEEIRDIEDYRELLDNTVDMENPFAPAPLGDTVVMEQAGTPLPEDAAA